MPRIMAIDYGTKRVGIAVTDPLQIIATALTSVSSFELMAYLDDYFKKEAVEILVVGEPLKLDGSRTNLSQPANEFVAHFRKKFPNIKIEREDERYTSKMAVDVMLMSGSKKKDRQKKENIDKVSAVIILQSYLLRFKK